VNLDNLTIIGPGSEWFWAMAQLVVVAVSLGAVYRQLKTQGAANALTRITSLQRHWESSTLALARLQAALRLRYPDGSGIDGPLLLIGGFFDDIWDLYENGYLTRGDIVANWGLSAYNWWHLVRAEVEGMREADREPAYSGFEKLAATAAKALGAEGIVLPNFDDATRRRYLELAIKRNRGELEIFRDAQAGIIPEVPSPNTPPGRRSEGAK
jgi:hypothetical protein